MERDYKTYSVTRRDDIVQFLAQASGTGPRVQSDELVVSPGDIVDFEITTNLIGSRATVRP